MYFIEYCTYSEFCDFVIFRADQNTLKQICIKSKMPSDNFSEIMKYKDKAYREAQIQRNKMIIKSHSAKFRNDNRGYNIAAIFHQF